MLLHGSAAENLEGLYLPILRCDYIARRVIFFNRLAHALAHVYNRRAAAYIDRQPRNLRQRGHRLLRYRVRVYLLFSHPRANAEAPDRLNYILLRHSLAARNAYCPYPTGERRRYQNKAQRADGEPRMDAVFKQPKRKPALFDRFHSHSRFFGTAAHLFVALGRGSHENRAVCAADIPIRNIPARAEIQKALREAPARFHPDISAQKIKQIGNIPAPYPQKRTFSISPRITA